jgi:hypothetical protein
MITTSLGGTAFVMTGYFDIKANKLNNTLRRLLLHIEDLKSRLERGPTKNSMSNAVKVVDICFIEAGP